MEVKRSGSSKLQGRIRELYEDADAAAPLDQRLFPAVLAQFGPPEATEMMRVRLGPVVGPAFAEDLRATVGWLYHALSAANSAGPAQAGERDRLRASMCEAIAHIEDWAERHGTDACGTPLEDASARRGWPAKTGPDKTGRGWTPPWDILAIDPPSYWATDT